MAGRMAQLIAMHDHGLRTIKLHGRGENITWTILRQNRIEHTRVMRSERLAAGTIHTYDSSSPAKQKHGMRIHIMIDNNTMSSSDRIYT
jgi:hypothetical protein